LVDHGFKLEQVTQSRLPGASPGYQMSGDLPPAQVAAVMDECGKLRPPRVEKTDAELRVVFDRWIQERACLVKLGFQPVEPPTFETFVAGWRGASVWMPIDGIDLHSPGGDMAQAKKTCTLEMLP
jgi:hypothetical protein